MKYFLILLTLFTTLLLGDEGSLFGLEQPTEVKAYKTKEHITLDDIAKYSSKFEKLLKLNKDNEPEISLTYELFFPEEENLSVDVQQWIMIELDENLSTGNYWIEHTLFEFDEHSFAPHQLLEHFSLFGRSFFSFHYEKGEDKQKYFLKVTKQKLKDVVVIYIYTPQKFSKLLDEYSFKMLISFFFLGLIFMTALYNGALYLYNREKSFLYYMLMQTFMVLVLIYHPQIINNYVMTHMQSMVPVVFLYLVLTLSSTLFALLFLRSFLETKIYLPRHERVLRYITIAVIIDLVLFPIPILMIFSLYSVMMFYFLWVIWLRIKAGYRPAIFLFLGWLALTVGIVWREHFSHTFFDPMLIGSTIEALLLSIALSYKIKENQKEKEKQKEMLVHQSRLASMGEMLGNIAHQWRQPLTGLGYILMNIEDRDKEQLHRKKLKEAFNQLDFMSQTIDDFRNFYKPDKEKEPFGLVEEIQDVLALLNFKEIEVELKSEKEITIINYKNEYKQVVLNLLSNAKDVLLERAITSAKILIEIEKEKVTISDNAGGIKLQEVQKIFEPYFTTKKQGLGIGLYISKVIIEKNMGGKMEVKNSKDGAVFSSSFSSV